jgi:hypothetical protein
MGRFNRLTFFGGKLTKSSHGPDARADPETQPPRPDWEISIPRALARMLKNL